MVRPYAVTNPLFLDNLVRNFIGAALGAYNLEPKNTVFLDDMKNNIETVKKFVEGGTPLRF